MFLLFMLMTVSTSLAGDPCKKVKQHTDAFGVTSRGAIVAADIGGFQQLSIVARDGKRELTMMQVMRGSIDTVAPAGTVGEFKLADGSVVSLPTAKASDPVTNANSSTVFTQWQMTYDLDPASLVALARSPIVAARTEVGPHEVQLTLASKKGARLQRAAACIQ